MALRSTFFDWADAAPARTTMMASAIGAVRRGNQQDRIHPRGMVRSQQRAAARRDIFLALQVQPVQRMCRDPEQQAQQRINEFLRLLPLTLEIAGLSRCELGRYFNEDQMSLRANTLKNAYKVARQLISEVAYK